MPSISPLHHLDSTKSGGERKPVGTFNLISHLIEHTLIRRQMRRRCNVMTQDWIPFGVFVSAFHSTKKAKTGPLRRTRYLVRCCVNGRGPLYPPSLFRLLLPCFDLPPLFRVFLWPWILGENSLYVKLVSYFPPLVALGGKEDGGRAESQR